MNPVARWLLPLAWLLTGTAYAQEADQVLVVPLEGESKVRMRHSMDMQGMIMNANKDVLPSNCEKISGDVNITVRAGRKYAKKFNGKTFAYDQQQWAMQPCSRVTVRFINDDPIRHQFMIHGLPEYLYPPTGMFMIELTGPGEKTATFILYKEPKTYLVHCELTQHMESGMKAQLKVGGGDGDLPSVPGLTPAEKPDIYPMDWTWKAAVVFVIAVIVGLILIVVISLVLRRAEALN